MKTGVPAQASDFIQRCASGVPVTLIGPLLKQYPEWPLGPVIFVDGGVRWRRDLPADFPFPSLSVGDGDSSGDAKLDILLDARKDFSDLGFALEILTEVDIGGLVLLGFLGSRRDHEWINIGEVARFLESKKQLRADFIGTSAEVTLLGPGNYVFNYTGTFSIVHFQDSSTCISGAVEYPLPEGSRVLAHSSHGLSNQAHGEFQISSDQVSLLFWITDRTTCLAAK